VAVAIGAAAGMAAATRQLFSPVLFAALLVGSSGQDAVRGELWRIPFQYLT